MPGGDLLTPSHDREVWPQAVTQTCIVHLLRASFRYASRKDWSAIARDLPPVEVEERHELGPGRKHSTQLDLLPPGQQGTPGSEA